ncbi:hypothetical protein [Actinoplanes teichomyceticus]|uniref:Uncharacterized protein n=1 Tax=Actinoplanes teichomyceticus TaxID=1867 RepID=A0A561WA41_ACTTI|nr:hypothetical protein [Actinoplanes teichomyceticus]TWG20719.1 hypothetical protein FHX34_103248 [Actinoplanes teichomyceticus]GIF14375.1 hypothetical protein Ate01nite_44070 [Actinoplanes teichomyceticus]
MADDFDDPLVRFGRWALAKVWLGCVLSGGYALGRHYHWPQAFLTCAAMLGAVALALASSFLPIWTRQRPSGIPVVDVGLRVMVWAGLAGSVAALLIALPAVGMVAAALLFTTAARTFRDPFGPLLRRLPITPTVAYRSAARRPASAPDRRPRYAGK